MENVESASPAGSHRPVTMRNLDITDSRDKLAIYAGAGLLSGGEGSQIFELDQTRLIGSEPKNRG